MNRPDARPVAAEGGRRSAFRVFLAFLQLGFTSFGGPIAHIGYFRDAFVVRRGWIDERAYAELVALCQFLPGPASSQIGIAIGLLRAGLIGGLAAWLGFTLPSAVMMALFGSGIALWGEGMPAGILHGLMVVAVAVVAQAVWGMARGLCPDRVRMTLAFAAAAAALAAPTPAIQVAIIVCGGLIGLAVVPEDAAREGSPLDFGVSRRVAAGALAVFFTLLIGLPIAAAVLPSQALALVEGFYRAGSLVFGGGHVVLPLLQAQVVPTGWVTADSFLAGYGAAQAVPGPLFTFAAFLGTVMTLPPNGWLGAAICLLAVFLPSFLLVVGVLPFWGGLVRAGRVRRALNGINAAVVGLLLAALYDPIWTGAIGRPLDFALALAAFALLVFWKAPAWAVVVAGAAGGYLLP